jgi:flagellar basal body-associated protein FliL
MVIRFLTILLLCLSVAALPVQAAGGGGGHGSKKKDKSSTDKGAPKHQREITTLESWVTVYPIAVSIVQDDKVRGQFQVWLGMDVPDEALRARAEEIKPRLRDAWMSRLSQYASTTLRERRPANIEDVSRLLQSTADQTLGKPGSRVLLGSVIVNMN